MPYLIHTRDIDVPPRSSGDFKLPTVDRQASNGDLLLLTFVSNLSSPKAVISAWLDCESQCSRSSMKSVARSIADDIEGGSSMSAAMAKHVKVFGALAIGFVELAEHGLGMKASLQKYFEMQEQRSKNAEKSKPWGLSRHTLDFAFVSGTLLKCGAAVTDAFSLAASDKPKRFKTEVARIVKIIHDGDEIAPAFDPQHGKGFFRFKFDERFRKALAAAEASGKAGQLAEALVLFGGHNWSMHKL